MGPVHFFCAGRAIRYTDSGFFLPLFIKERLLSSFFSGSSIKPFLHFMSLNCCARAFLSVLGTYLLGAPPKPLCAQGLKIPTFYPFFFLLSRFCQGRLFARSSFFAFSLKFSIQFYLHYIELSIVRINHITIYFLATDLKVAMIRGT